MKAKNDGAIFIMPRSSKDWVGAEALWITVAGWSAAAKRQLGMAWVVTSDRIAQPEEVIHYPLIKPESIALKRSILFTWIPLFFKTIIKDILLWRKSRDWGIVHRPPWVNTEVAFVWQQHDLFAGPGYKLARKLGVPLVTYVHAPVIWETAKWGVKRYFWGWFLERFVEAPALRKSDLVLCVSEEVAKKLMQMGVNQKKILISPMAVDPFLFVQDGTDDTLKNKLGLKGKIVIGWTGSFRSFHGLDLLVKAFQRVYKQQPNSRLLLVGDGLERKKLEGLVSELELKEAVIFAGRQPFAKIPSYVSIFDIAVVSTRSVDGFHYSPLKLREYLVARKATLAPRVGEILHLFRSEEHLLLYEVGNLEQIASGLLLLIHDDQLRTNLEEHGYEYVVRTCTWDFHLKETLDSLNKF